eukprot:scaffold269667_cov35-Tisochrysis_lutea.AAC.2
MAIARKSATRENRETIHVVEVLYNPSRSNFSLSDSQAPSKTSPPGAWRSHLRRCGAQGLRNEGRRGDLCGDNLFLSASSFSLVRSNGFPVLEYAVRMVCNELSGGVAACELEQHVAPRVARQRETEEVEEAGEGKEGKGAARRRTMSIAAQDLRAVGEARRGR